MNHPVDYQWLWDSLRVVIADKASYARARRDVATVEALESIQTTIGRLIEAERHRHYGAGDMSTKNDPRQVDMFLHATDAEMAQAVETCRARIRAMCADAVIISGVTRATSLSDD